MFQQIHIVACSPRTGTTLLHEAMVTCFKVDKHYQHEVRFHQSDAKAGEVLVTKRPKDTYYMSKVLADTPGLHVIYLLRDPRDAIVSRHAKDKTKFYSNIPLWRELHSYGKALRRFDNCIEIKYEDFVTNPDAIQQIIHDKFPWLEKRYAFSDYHKDVTPDRTPSYYPEKITWFSRLSLKMHGAQKVAAFRRLRNI